MGGQNRGYKQRALPVPPCQFRMHKHLNMVGAEYTGLPIASLQHPTRGPQLPGTASLHTRQHLLERSYARLRARNTHLEESPSESHDSITG